MENPLNNPGTSKEQELVIPEPLQTPFAGPPPYGGDQNENLPVRQSGGFVKRIVKWLVIILIIITVVIGGYWALANYLPQYAKYVQPYLEPLLDPVLEQIQPMLDKIGLAKPVDPIINQPQGPAGSTPTPLAGLSQPDTSNWKTYQNFELGFEFQYPSAWGELEFLLRDCDDGGRLFRITFSIRKDVDFGGNSENCSEPRGAGWTDFIGYKKESTGKYIYNFSEGRGFEVIPTKVIEPLEILVIGHQDLGLALQPTDRAALLNMPNLTFRGIAFAYYNIPKEEEVMFDQILSTFKFPPDADGDGLPDEEEPKYKTDPNNRDTDGDGHLDGQEVQNGYNPLGPGKAQ